MTTTPGGRSRPTVALPAAVMVVAMALSTFPTPLYPAYERRYDIGPFGVTGLFAAFAAGAVVSLLIVARASRGRTAHLPGWWLVAAAGLTSAASAAILSLDGGVGWFAAARALAGAGAGAGAAVSTAVIIAAARRRSTLSARRWTVVAPALTMCGLALGPLSAGIVVGALGAPGPTAYRVFAGLLVLLTAGLAWSSLADAHPGPSTPTTAGAAAHPGRTDDGRPVSAPLRWRALAAFATTGVFGALTPTLLAAVLTAPGTATVGACAAVPFVAAAVGAVARIRRPGPGAAGMVLGLGGLLVATAVASLPVFLVAAAVAGFGTGVLFRTALGAALAAADPVDHRRVTAVVLRWAYTGLSVPVLGLGLAADRLPLPAALALFAAGVGAAALAGLRPLPTAGPAVAVTIDAGAGGRPAESGKLRA